MKRVENFIKKFDPRLKISVLKDSVKTPNNVTEALKCELGAIVKNLILKVDFNF